MATVPVVAKLDGAVRAGGDLEAKLRAFLAWFSWRLAGKLALIFGAVTAVTWFIAFASVLWHQNNVKNLIAQEQALTPKVEELQR